MTRNEVETIVRQVIDKICKAPFAGKVAFPEKNVQIIMQAIDEYKKENN